MERRTITDYLRDEYFSLLPDIRLATEELEAEVRHLLIPTARHRAPHELIVVKSRVKECESAIAALRRRKNWTDVMSSGPPPFSLLSLNDLAGVRILVFPRTRVTEIDDVLRGRFNHWTADPVPPAPGTAAALALKYHGYCSKHCRIRSEVQLMSMLVGLFWEVEHGAIYKPDVQHRDMELSLKMLDRNADVIRAMQAFETEFEAVVAAECDRAASPLPPPQATADFSTLCG